MPSGSRCGSAAPSAAARAAVVVVVVVVVVVPTSRCSSAACCCSSRCWIDCISFSSSAARLCSCSISSSSSSSSAAASSGAQGASSCIGCCCSGSKALLQSSTAKPRSPITTRPLEQPGMGASLPGAPTSAPHPACGTLTLCSCSSTAAPPSPPRAHRSSSSSLDSSWGLWVRTARCCSPMLLPPALPERKARSQIIPSPRDSTKPPDGTGAAAVVAQLLLRSESQRRAPAMLNPSAPENTTGAPMLTDGGLPSAELLLLPPVVVALRSVLIGRTARRRRPAATAMALPSGATASRRPRWAGWGAVGGCSSGVGSGKG